MTVLPAALLAEIDAGRTGLLATPLGVTAEGRPLRTFRFGAGQPRRALVLGGVHGSERSGVEVAEAAADALAVGCSSAFDVVVVPALFPDHVAIGLREGEIPTNRNFPPAGRGLTWASTGNPARDALGRPILPENQALIGLIERFRPERIASVHATEYPERAGIFADPHGVPPQADAGETAHLSATAARRTDEDAALAIAMARRAARDGARIPGNDLDGNPCAVWSGEVDDGVSLGSWAPIGVRDGPSSRESISVITVEIDGLARSDASPDPSARRRELTAFRDAILDVFLA